MALPTIGKTFRRALASTWQGFRSMPLLFLSAFAGVVAVTFATKFFGFDSMKTARLIADRLSASEGLRLVAQIFLAYFFQTLFLAPVAVAMHRFILRGEVTKGIVSILPSYTQVYVAWLMLIEVVRMASRLPAALGPPEEARAPLLVLVYAAGLAITIVGVRFALLFPSAAIGAPSDGFFARAGESWTRTRGHFWYIVGAVFLIGLVVAIPIVWVMWGLMVSRIGDVFVAGEPLRGPEFLEGLFTSAPVMLLNATLYVVLTAAVAAGLSWIYRALVENRTGDA